ncbi:MAG: radical SAM family heme chaperone HemW [Planctomycetes bacterium]|nr:radical SAM family heme chaperone HemW [Planctomycetota bacterium]
MPSLPFHPPASRDVPCGLYVHVPFCETKCGYCDFYSVPLKDRATGPLVSRIIRELRMRTSGCPLPIRTVFFGGGTPTLLPPEELRELLACVAGCVPSAALEEFTVEANPATVDDTKVRLLAEHGVTRVSMGAQSFFPGELEVLERLHRPDDIPPSVAALRRGGIGQINLDLIFGIPGQSLETWRASLRRAVELGPDHIACYGLTYEPGTRLTAQRHAGRVTPCEEDLEAEMYLLAIDLLAEAGYRQYETSNFARHGRECRHNLIYWRNQPYLGVGPSAAGCVDTVRYKNVADIGAYIQMMDAQGHAEAEREELDTTRLMMELVLMQLRLVDGLSIADFRERTGVDPRAVFAAELSRFTPAGWMQESATHLALTRTGRLVADRIIAELAAACGPTALPLPILATMPAAPPG